MPSPRCSAAPATGRGSGRGGRRNFDARGVTAHGSTVVVWGREVGAARGAYLVSRDGGVTLQLGAQGPRPVWAALDPHRPSELLTVGENGQLARLRIE